MGDPSTNFRCSRVSLREIKDYDKNLDLKLDEKTSVHIYMLREGMIAGMFLFSFWVSV